MGRHSIDDGSSDATDPAAGHWASGPGQEAASTVRPGSASGPVMPIDGVVPMPAPDEPITEVQPIWAPDTTTGLEPVRPRGNRSLMLVAVAGLITLAVAVLLVAMAVFTGSTPPPGSVADGDATTGNPVPAPTASTEPTPEPTTGATAGPPTVAGGQLTGVYAQQQAWPGGFIARVTVTNSGPTDQDWQVTLDYPDTVTGYVTGWSNAPAAPHTVATAHSATITGAVALHSGQSISAFVQFGTSADGVAPTDCAVNGTACGQG